MKKLKLFEPKVPALTSETTFTINTPPTNFAETMQAVHKASGHVERRIIPMRCGKYDRPYAVIYKREPGETLYVAEKVVKEPPPDNGDPGILARHFSGKGKAKNSYDTREFSGFRLPCPWCGDEGGTVHCSHCDATYCAHGRTKQPDGSHIHRCVPRCGAEFTLVPSINIDGHQAKAKSARRGVSHYIQFGPADMKQDDDDVKLLPKK